ncbi:MAG: thioredoxin domain-containing protein, partial [Acidimicrobiales bacterium]
PGGTPAFAADHAWLVACCTRLGELTGLARWTALAVEVVDALLDRFWDGERGGVFTTGHGDERLVARAKDVLDGAVPSAGSAAAGALLRLAALTGEESYQAAGERIVAMAAPLLAEQPLAVADLVDAAGLLAGRTEVVVAGDRPDLVAEVRRRWLPEAVLSWGERRPTPLWEGRKDGAAYVCRGFACRTPATEAGTLASQLGTGPAGVGRAEG